MRTSLVVAIVAIVLLGGPWANVAVAKTDAETLRRLRLAAAATVVFVVLLLLGALGIHTDTSDGPGLF